MGWECGGRGERLFYGWKSGEVVIVAGMTRE